MLQDAAFWILALAAVGTGTMVFIVDSMARATFALLASFLCVGTALLLIDLHYLGILVVLMMIMEMLVMAVFMLMYMMNPAGLMPMTMVHNNRAALGISAGVFALLTAGIFTVHWPRREGAPPPDPTRALGQALMGPKMLVMMVIGLAILATMIASVVLATNRGRYDLAEPAPTPDAPTQPAEAHAAHDHAAHTHTAQAQDVQGEHQAHVHDAHAHDTQPQGTHTPEAHDHADHAGRGHEAHGASGQGHGAHDHGGHEGHGGQGGAG
ncbi:NADH-quinone oxidoreductase subunit J [Spirillospora sp. NPDC052269]